MKINSTAASIRQNTTQALLNAQKQQQVQNTANDDKAAASQQAGMNTPPYAVNLATQGTGDTQGLTLDEIAKLQDDVSKSQQLMISQLTEVNAKLQGYQDQGIGKLNFDGLNIDTSQFALPAVATTPEEAQQALSEGGDWSVDAVAGRIMDMATSIAGGDETKLEQMRSAVQKGFEQAGAAFNKVYGTTDMPQITQDTQAEIMKRFDSVQASYQQAAGGTTQTGNEQLVNAAKEVM